MISYVMRTLDYTVITNFEHNIGLFLVLFSCRVSILELYLTASPDHFTQNCAHYAKILYFDRICTINRVFPGARGKTLAPVLIILFTQNVCKKGGWYEEKLVSKQ
jgi:hypothetical protein